MPSSKEIKKSLETHPSSEPDFKNAAIHFGRALSSVANLVKIIVIGDDAQVAGKLLKQTFSKSYEGKFSSLSAISKEKEYLNEVQQYTSSSFKSGLSELKNVAVELTLACFYLLKGLTKVAVAVASISANLALKSIVPEFKSKLHQQQLECKTISVEDAPNEGPRPK